MIYLYRYRWEDVAAGEFETLSPLLHCSAQRTINDIISLAFVPYTQKVVAFSNFLGLYFGSRELRRREWLHRTMHEKQTGLEHNKARVDRSWCILTASNQVNEDDDDEQYLDVSVWIVVNWLTSHRQNNRLFGSLINRDEQTQTKPRRDLDAIVIFSIQGYSRWLWGKDLTNKYPPDRHLFSNAEPVSILNWQTNGVRAVAFRQSTSVNFHYEFGRHCRLEWLDFLWLAFFNTSA